MIGGYFERHPKGTPKGVVTVVDAKHPATAKLPKTIERNDEWYYYKDFDPTMHVLITIDPATIGDSGEADVNPNPLVWCHDFGGGRVFYSGSATRPSRTASPTWSTCSPAHWRTPSASSASRTKTPASSARGRSFVNRRSSDPSIFPCARACDASGMRPRSRRRDCPRGARAWSCPESPP